MVVKLRNILRNILLKPYYLLLTKFYGMDISSRALIPLGAKLDKTYPQGIHIGYESYIASGVIVFSHDFTRSLHANTYIGSRCFIEVNAIIMAGLKIGDNVIVGAGARSD